MAKTPALLLASVWSYLVTVSRFSALTVTLACVANGPLHAAVDPHNEATEEQKQFFNDKVYPVLESHCYRCHGGEDKLKGEFRITSREGLIRGGELGPGLNLQQPERSLLLEMVSWKDSDHEMPPKKPLERQELAILQQWVHMGAPFDPAKEIKGKRQITK